MCEINISEYRDNFVSQSFCSNCDENYVNVHKNLTMTSFLCPTCNEKCYIDDLFKFNLFVNALKLFKKSYINFRKD